MNYNPWTILGWGLTGWIILRGLYVAAIHTIAWTRAILKTIRHYRMFRSSLATPPAQGQLWSSAYTDYHITHAMGTPAGTEGLCINIGRFRSGKYESVQLTLDQWKEEQVNKHLYLRGLVTLLGP